MCPTIYTTRSYRGRRKTVSTDLIANSHHIIQCIPGTACNSCSAISIVALLLFEAPALACINCLSHPDLTRHQESSDCREEMLCASPHCLQHVQTNKSTSETKLKNLLSKKTKCHKCNGATLLQRIHWQ